MLHTIIIVDDSATARMIIKRCFQIAGYHDTNFLEAKNGLEALKLARGNDVGLIVSDLNMPTMDGRKLLRHIKASPRLTDLPVMVITSSSNPAIEKELLDLGAFAVLNKPISPSNIAMVLQNAIEQPKWGE